LLLLLFVVVVVYNTIMMLLLRLLLFLILELRGSGVADCVVLLPGSYGNGLWFRALGGVGQTQLMHQLT
jgi:hypothetical protein